MANYEQHQELYKVSASTKKMQIWKGWCDGNEVCCKYGQVGGKLQTKVYAAIGKNQGRSNETSDEEQALLELQAMYQSQLDNKHYKLSQTEAIESSEVCRIPRKITNYKDRYNKMSDKLLSSVKKNGSRGCLLKGELFSKAGRFEEIKVDHLRAVVEELGEQANFDAEVYAEGLSLQRIRSAWLKPYKTDKEIIKVAKDAAKKRGVVFKGTKEEAVEYLGYNPNEDAPQLKLHIFDIPDDTGLTFVERVELMHKFEDMVKEKHLEIYFEFLYPVETNSHEERMKLLDEVVAAGSEGLVHYEVDGIYEFGKRSTNTAKSKPRYDSEALVTGVEMCKNYEGKLLLKASDALGGVTFKAMMKGTHESRMYNVQEQFIGQWVTFQYEELSDSGVPTKPTVMETRLCDAKGEPLE